MPSSTHLSRHGRALNAGHPRASGSATDLATDRGHPRRSRLATMPAAAPSPVPQDRQAALDRLLLEIRDAVGSFVASRAVSDGRFGGGPDEPGSAGPYALAPRDAGAGAGAELAGADLEAAVRGRHLRAGRALLDWAMSDLAEASGLSLSTVRRLEQDAEGLLARNRSSAVQALQRAGIRFLPVGTGTVAVAMMAQTAPPA